ncbi:hypothetical protein M5D96_002326 [Drosophila gunungcola]|uniref:ZAD domain-containing protein n=2 Tax=Drosophila gunungcola TaxID=103775 RepID=A0A9P9YZT4_9MUSC|nr:hypothetical protein M5D96_002326 [Drosophila gunungcola]
MRGELTPQTCRVCLEPSARLQRLDESREEGEETPNEMLIQLLGVSYSKLNDKENIPDGICKSCKVELNMAYQFREKALRKQGEIEDYCRELGLLDDSDDMLIKEEDGSQSQCDEEMYILEESTAGEGDHHDDKVQEEYLEVETS